MSDNNGDQPPMSEEEKRYLLDFISEIGVGFTPVQIFNSIYETDSASEGIEGLSSQHENMLGLHGFMAGFQYIVIGDDFSADSNTNQKIVLTLQTAGFLTSLMGTLLSLVAMQFLNTLKKEPPRVQVEGVFRVYPYIRNSDYCGVLATIILALSTVISLFDKLEIWISIPFAVATALGLGVIFKIMLGIILNPKESFYQARHINAYLEQKKAGKRPEI